MFSNFREDFLNENESKIPKSIFEYLKKGLPKDFYYEYDDKIELFILNSPKGINIQSGNIQLPIDKKFFLKNGKVDLELLKEYSYNAQTELVFLPDENGCFKVNGENIPVDSFAINPMKGLKSKNSFIVLKPPNFPEAFDIKVSGYGHESKLKIKRKPNNSINTMSFETISETGINLNYQINLKKSTFKVTISKTVTENTSVKDVVNANYIINAFVEGKATFGNIPIEKIKSTTLNRISDKDIEFWNKVFEVEKIFNVEFNPDIDISRENAKELYELYSSIKENKPFKRYKKFNSFKGNFQIKDESIFNKIIGEEISIEFDGANELNIFGQTIKYYSLMILHKTKVTNIYFNENEESIIEVDDPNDGKMFVYQMDFLTKDDLDAFRNREDYVSILEKAEEIDYIEGQI